MPSTPEELNRIAEAFRALVRVFSKRFELFGTFGVKLIRQLADGTFEERPDDPTIPGDTKVPYLVGLPGFRVKVPNGARGALAFLHGERMIPPTPVVAGFDAGGPVTEVAFDGGTKPVARVDDTVNVGRLLVVTTSGNVTAITYFAPGVALPDPLPAGGVAISLSGVISSGCSKLKA